MYNDLLLNRLAAGPVDEEAEINDLIDEIEELDSILTPEAQELIADLRPHIVTDDVYEEIDEQASLDAMFDKSRTIIKTEERIAYIKDIQRSMAESMLIVPYTGSAGYGYVQPWIENYYDKGGYGYIIESWAKSWFTKERIARG